MKLVFRSGPRSDEELEIDREMVLGREGADIEIEDSAVSRKHAILRPAGDNLEIEDLESTNGTYVNGMKIDAPTTLEPGDFINIGQSTLEVGGVDWRSAETQAMSIPAAVVSEADEQDEYIPTSPISVEDTDPKSPLSAIPKKWLFAGAGVILLILLIVAISSLIGGPDKKEVVAQADTICRRSEQELRGVELTAGSKTKALKADAGRLIEERTSVIAELRKLELAGDMEQPFRAYVERTSTTNDRLRTVQGLKPNDKKKTVQGAIAGVKDAARAETKEARSVGFRVCGGLPV